MDKLNMLAALPEIVLLVAASLVVMADALLTGKRRIAIDRLALVALLFPLIATVWQFDSGTQYAYNNMYVADSLGHLLKLCAYVAIAVTLIWAYIFPELRRAKTFDLPKELTT